ncbi:MAG: hypothetical protein HOG03_20130 [Desulfobacula sp.]|jgi:hypothetical protein|uniref:hypothetical protein n=1 Tax=Desulfobacula sp. TaxID=2593537 RepID=UPI001DC146D3|nr:hypothetical protein [Desulfobacula sp.]MBT3806879.1 hypothetical protein [Desulfobacula sp.]MBT4027736.1 hypothetical protein [Desulfobacula sp.]MBT6341345.1 hypothetical protein [Desulfobacula sp.]
MNQFKYNAGQCNNDKGAMLIGLIAAITIIGIMSAGTIYFTSGSGETGLFANANSRAYYLAESGINYAKLNVQGGKTYASDTQFKLDNGDAFVIRTKVDPKDSSRTIIYSTGIVNSGSWFESKYDLTSNYLKSGGGDLTDIVKLTTLDKKGKPVLNPIWTFKGGKKVKPEKDKLGLQSNKGKDKWNWVPGSGKGKGKGKGKGSKGKWVKVKTYVPILLSLGWWKTNPDNPDLAKAWTDNSELLSYETQVKIKLDDKVDYFLHGISFRLSPKNPDWTYPWNLKSYGISYFKSKDTTWPFDIGLSGFNAIMNDKVYMVLWEKPPSTKYLVLKDYKLLTTADGVIDGSDLKDWSTILLKLEEKSDGNYISGFVQGTDTKDAIPYALPLGTISWNYAHYNPVKWKLNSSQPIKNNDLRTIKFSTYTPDEIGLHAFYASTASGKQYFADFSLKFGSSGASSSFQW